MGKTVMTCNVCGRGTEDMFHYICPECREALAYYKNKYFEEKLMKQTCGKVEAEENESEIL